MRPGRFGGNGFLTTNSHLTFTILLEYLLNLPKPFFYFLMVVLWKSFRELEMFTNSNENLTIF
jgi:hypothetical protein